MSIKQFSKAKETAQKNPSIITEFELRVLELYMLKDVRSVAKELNVAPQVIYRVFQRIRERRKRSQHTVNFWNDLAKSKRLYHVLTPKPEATEQEDEDS